MRSKARIVGTAAVLTAALAAGVWYATSGPDPLMPLRAPIVTIPAPGGSAPRTPAWLSADVRPPAPPVAVAPFPDQMAHLTASGDPRDAYAAYRLVRACVAQRAQPAQSGAGAPPDDGALAGIPDQAAFCAGMTERMRMDSVAMLEKAARAGVDGAMAALVEEGPFGDPAALVTRPDDPLVKDWKARVNGMLAEQAGQGNWSSLYLAFTGFMFGNPAIAADRQSALAYGIALRDILVKVDGMTEDEAIPFNAPFLDQVKAGLSREQQDQAVAQAASIVDTALRRRNASPSTI